MKAPRAISHPASITALALLLINDHVFKSALSREHPWLCGKLSDFAFLALAPVFALSLYECVARGREPHRRAVVLSAMASVGAVFVAIKLSPACAATVGALWGLLQAPFRHGRWIAAPITVDPTDLLALPSLATALWVERRSRATGVAPREHAHCQPAR